MLNADMNIVFSSCIVSLVLFVDHSFLILVLLQLLFLRWFSYTTRQRDTQSVHIICCWHACHNHCSLNNQLSVKVIICKPLQTAGNTSDITYPSFIQVCEVAFAGRSARNFYETVLGFSEKFPRNFQRQSSIT